MGASASESQFDEGIGKDTIKLLLRFVAIIVASPLIGWMMARAWVPGHLIYDLTAKTMKEVLGVGLAHALQMFTTGGMGLYFGFLTIFILDIKKRVQGALLLLGTALGLVVLTIQGVLIPNIDWAYTPNLMAFGVLYVAALFLDIDKLLSISIRESSLKDPRTSSGEVPEFRNAAKGLFWILALIIVLSLVQVALAGAFEPLDIVAAVIGIYLLHSFIQYEVKSDYMLLGPGQSGKSMAMLGMALTMYDFDDVQPDPNSYLQSAIDHAGDPKYEDDWPFEQTEELQESSFQMLVGDIFPRRMRLVAFDYPGQFLPEISDRVRELASSSILDFVPFVGGTADGTPELQADGGKITDRGDIVNIVAKNVVRADTLMVVIDCERLVHPQVFGGNDDGGAGDSALGIEYYEPILDNTDVENTIIMATKADVLIHDDTLPVDSPEDAGGFDAFKQQVNVMLDERVAIQEMKQQLGQTEIHPVFYKTIKKDGEYVPLRDNYHNMVPVGYRELVDTIRRAH